MRRGPAEGGKPPFSVETREFWAKRGFVWHSGTAILPFRTALLICGLPTTRLKAQSGTGAILPERQDSCKPVPGLL